MRLIFIYREEPKSILGYIYCFLRMSLKKGTPLRQPGCSRKERDKGRKSKQPNENFLLVSIDLSKEDEIEANP
eukprot:snap_masked-scaffold_81-processed-gene-0.40-mRNA-1 protein AED:1.00 eAED:1.00 QI:0/-1/0/0/-1/1/1/0/72